MGCPAVSRRLAAKPMSASSCTSQSAASRQAPACAGSVEMLSIRRSWKSRSSARGSSASIRPRTASSPMTTSLPEQRTAILAGFCDRRQRERLCSVRPADPAAAEHPRSVGRVEDAGLARRHALLGCEQAPLAPAPGQVDGSSLAPAAGSTAPAPPLPSRLPAPPRTVGRPASSPPRPPPSGLQAPRAARRRPDAPRHRARTTKSGSPPPMPRPRRWPTV